MLWAGTSEINYPSFRVIVTGKTTESESVLTTWADLLPSAGNPPDACEKPETETPLSDGQLIAAARRGDADAWRELYQRWMPWVWRYAYALVLDRHVAEDITSESMAAWVKKFNETGDTAAQCAGWLRSVIRHKAVDHHRRSGRTRRAMEGLTHQSAPERDNHPANVPLERRETRTQVMQALGELKESYRIVLEWKYSQGLSVREIASRLGVTEKSVEANLYRARLEFRRQYEALQPSNSPAIQTDDTIASRS